MQKSETSEPARIPVELAPGHPRGLNLENPVMNASGTFGYGVEYAQFVDIHKLGAVVSKGTTLLPRPGNPQPRTKETPAGMLNSIGLQNVGVEAVIRDKAPLWAAWQVPVIVNICGDAAEDYVSLASRLDGVPGVSALEVNISCPNIKQGGISFGVDPEMAASLTRQVIEATSLPVIVKLTPNVTDIVPVAEAVAAAGAHALCLGNTLRGMAIDIANRRPYLGNRTGGLSGPAIRPVAVWMVYQVARHVKIPIVGCGGIVDAADALEFIMAGASAVQVGTSVFVDPSSMVKVVEGILEFMEREGVKDLKEIIGAALED